MNGGGGCGKRGSGVGILQAFSLEWCWHNVEANYMVPYLELLYFSTLASGHFH